VTPPAARYVDRSDLDGYQEARLYPQRASLPAASGPGFWMREATIGHMFALP
jgi:hypothetical protein